MNAIVGYTGFVGSNLFASGAYDRGYNTKNIEEAYGSGPDLLVYAGMRAAKYLANHDPERDRAAVVQAEKNLSLIHPRRLVLISTIDVFKNPEGVDETSPVCTDGLEPYGYNRRQLESWVREHFPTALIIRLPGLFGINLKKNFIYDFMSEIPAMLSAAKLHELAGRDARIMNYYGAQQNGFYKAEVNDRDRETVKKFLRGIGFTALNFTDSRSIFQFYNLARLQRDIETALSADIHLLHPATEPVSAAEIYKYLTGRDFVNELVGRPAHYDYRTIHAKTFGGRHGYICDKNEVLREIGEFVKQGVFSVR